MAERDELVTYIWDAYKDAHGIRPRHIDFDVLSVSELSEMADRVSDQVCNSIKENASQEAAAAVKFEKRVAELIEIGAGNRETAIRWLLDGIDSFQQTEDALRWEFGLAFGYTL